MATKEELTNGLEMVIRESRRLATDLSPEQWQGVVDLDGWKNQEVLAHIAGVGSVVVPMSGGLLSGAPINLTMDTVDQMNAGFVAQRAQKSPADLADEVETAYRGIIEFIKGAPDDALARNASVGGYRDIPASDILLRMTVLHGIGHIYSVYIGIFTAGMAAAAK
jgi:hypothetical protein